MSLINSALVIDLTVFSLCAFLLLKLGRLSAMHPATTYLFFHLWVVTKRLTELNLGAPLSAAFPYQPITLTELTRAALMFDVVLFVMTLGWIITSAVDLKKNGPLPAPGQEKAPNLSKTYTVGFARIMVPLGLLGILGVHGDGTTGAGGVVSTMLGIVNLWLPLSLMPLFYWYGPRRWLVGAALVVFWLCETRMGSTRWLILLPTVFFCYAFLSRSGLWWPPRKVTLLLALMGVLWLPGKEISGVIASGGGIADVAQTVASVWTVSATQANHPDTQFLDMGAMTVGLVDEKGKFFYGSTMWPALFNYVPRAIWPDKPASDQWEIDISTKDRPMSTYGMTASLMGAAYVDFGYAGIVIIPFLFSLFLGWAYFQAFRCSHYSVGRFAFLVMACILFQPYRDGMYSFFIFNMVCMMPMYIIVLLHLILPTRPVQARPRYPKFARLSPQNRTFSRP
jgi:hypothetical protein